MKLQRSSLVSHADFLRLLAFELMALPYKLVAAERKCIDKLDSESNDDEY